MATPYIPAEDADALTWMTAFSGGISANPGLFMLTSSDATTISNAVTQFNSAWFAANDPETRTQAQVSLKNQTRNAAEGVCRQYAITIKNNAAINDQDKINIGVRPINESREPVFCPQTSPLINVLGATPGTQTLRYADSNTPDSPAKAFGAIQLQLFVAIKDAPTADADEAEYYGSFTRNPIPVAFAETDDGKVASYFARWVGRRGDTGPWSQPVSMRIAA